LSPCRPVIADKAQPHEPFRSCQTDRSGSAHCSPVGAVGALSSSAPGRNLLAGDAVDKPPAASCRPPPDSNRWPRARLTADDAMPKNHPDETPAKGQRSALHECSSPREMIGGHPFGYTEGSPRPATRPVTFGFVPYSRPTGAGALSAVHRLGRRTQPPASHRGPCFVTEALDGRSRLDVTGHDLRARGSGSSTRQLSGAPGGRAPHQD
jgi:hypothetical protein